MLWFARCSKLHKPVLVGQERRLRGFTPQSENDVRADVGMLRKAGQRAVQQDVLVAIDSECTAAFVSQSDDAIDVREVLKNRLVKVFSDEFGTGR